ncbi:MAG: endonuclease, partial [Lutibacter sp.]
LKTNYMKKLYIFNFLLFFVISVWAQAPAGYYDTAAGKSGDALKLALNNIIKGHVQYPYTSTATDVWDILKESDRDPNNPNNVILLYTGWSVDAVQEYNNGAGWTREHVWAKSRGDFGTTPGPGTDCHHLRPCDVSVNSARNNRWFAECNEQYFDDGGTIPTDSWTSSTDWVWKPRDAEKGDVARMIFYMATRYEGFDGEPDLEVVDYIPADKLTIEPIHALLSDLLLWSQQDPVDDFERNRNEVVYGYQQNRNPFIDHPEYIDAIWGTVSPPLDPPTTPQNLSLVASATSLSLDWNDVSTEDGYYIYRSTDNVNFTILATLGSNIVNYTDNNVVEAQMYYYNVIAYNTYGNSSASITVNGELSTATGGGPATDLFFSEYVEGSSYNKALEVSNFTGADLDLSLYVIKKQTNGAGSWSTGYALTGLLSNGQSYVLAHSSSTQAILNVANVTTTSAEFSFNGNDAVSLWKDGVLIDIIGTFNDAANFAADVTLIRNSNIVSPNVNYTLSEWTSYSTDYFTDLGSHTFDGIVVPPSCDVPTGLLVNNITTVSVDLNWTAVTGAVDYSVQYKVSASSTWTTIVAGSNTLSISGLLPDTQYDVQVATVCSASSSAYCPAINFTTLPEVVVVNYCAPTGGTKFEWIESVSITEINNPSGKSTSGYSDFTNMTANISLGQTYPITFQAGFKRLSYTEYWSVWIDFNQDGDFDDVGESLAQGSTSDNGQYYMDLAIPTDALLGQTRLRIAMNDNGYYDACHSVTYGETEDYSVNISELKTGILQSKFSVQKAEFMEPIGISIYPNPTSDKLFVANMENAKIGIYSITGHQVQEFIITGNQVDVSHLKSGVYLIKFDNGEKSTIQKFIKK